MDAFLERIVSHEQALIDERSECCQNAADDGRAAHVEQTFVDAAQARGSPAGEDQRAPAQAARVSRVPHWPQNT